MQIIKQTNALNHRQYKDIFLTLSKHFLLVIYKILAGPILFYADVIYGKRLDESLKRNGPI